MHILYPHEVTEPAKPAPIELDDDLTRRDSWMFAPLMAIAIALPIFASAVFGFSVWHLANRDEVTASTPSAIVASRWPDQALPVIR